MALEKALFLRKLKKLSFIETALRQRRSVSATADQIPKEVAALDGKTENYEYDPNLRHKYPEFLPNPTLKWRNVIREKLELQDMLNRRKVIDIPEFYVGSVLSITVADKHATEKINRFVGICVERGGEGLRAWFTLRNVIENLGVEIKYELYCPLIQKIEVLRLEKRLDENLRYLKDAPNEYSTFPFNMEPEYHQAGAPVPINTLKVKLNPRPWQERYERQHLKGVELPVLSEKMMKQAVERDEWWRKYDLMDQYRATIPEEEQQQIFSEIKGTLEELESRRKTHKRQRTFIKPDVPKFM